MFAATAVCVFALISHCEAIIGGREAVAHSRPYMASIQHFVEQQKTHECGGFLVAEQWVMTAVHCFPQGTDNRKVVLGVHSLTQSQDTQQVFEILELHKNPNYSAENFDNDIALIKLDRPANITSAVQIVPFLRSGGTNPSTDEQADTAGWGASDNLAPDRTN
ncbi:hypothetical protein WMY93_017190 [Mugilogobius chulae]|uniref:trypsin n=1 Tax=Mugilogobius chulae TaxID=88201 RepID=A0AAW0NNP2_9GOBI